MTSRVSPHRGEQRLSTGAADGQDAARPVDPPKLPRQLRGWRTVKELVEELRFPSEDACRVWLRRQGIVSVRRGRVILVDGLDIDRVLRRA